MINIKIFFEINDPIVIQIDSKGISVKDFLKIISEKTNYDFHENEITLIDKKKDKIIDGDLQLLNNDEILIKQKNNNEAFAFLDVTKQNKIQIEPENNPSIPYYLTAKPGLNILGKCENENCDLMDKEQMINIKEDEYDMVKQNGIVKCISCKCNVIGKTIAFYKCYYNYYGKKYIENEKEDKIEKFGEKINDFNKIEISFDNKINVQGKSYEIHKTKDIEYFIYDDDKVKFLQLIFQVRKF